MSFGSGAAVPAASADDPLLPQLQASCCVATNSRSGPQPDYAPQQHGDTAVLGLFELGSKKTVGGFKSRFLSTVSQTPQSAPPLWPSI
jgi:hypothetical protein